MGSQDTPSRCTLWDSSIVSGLLQAQQSKQRSLFQLARTRSSTQALACVPVIRRARIGGRSFRLLAAKMWNNLPQSLRQGTAPFQEGT